jgi:membrane protein YqaA with SNARE-associated domain
VTAFAAIEAATATSAVAALSNATMALGATLVAVIFDAAFADTLGIVAGTQPVGWLLLAASLGNVLGSVVNWVLGRGVERFAGRRWFPASPEALARARGHYARWGRWSLLLAKADTSADAPAPPGVAGTPASPWPL